MEYVGLLEYSDVYQDMLEEARAGDEQLDTELSELEDDNRVDADYRDFLLSCIRRAEKDRFTAYKEETQNHNRDNDNAYDTEGEYDPEYELFLKNLRKHGKSYALHNETDGLPLVVYEQDSGSDSELDPEPRRLTRSATRHAREVSEQILDEEENSGLGSDCERDPVPRRKTRSSTKRDNEKPSYRESVELAKSKKVEKVASKIDEIEADTEYQEFHRSCKIVDGHLAYRNGGHSVVYFTTSEENDQENKTGDDDISDISSSDVEIIEMDEDASLNAEAEFRRRAISFIRKPYNHKEYNRLWEEITISKPVRRHKDLRNGRERAYATEKPGKSLLDDYPDLKQLLQFQENKRKCLNLVRGFVFYLQNFHHEGSFKPWEDAECLSI